MSLFTSLRASFGSRLALRPVPSAISSFHSSPWGLAMKESDTNRDDMNNVYEAEKEHQLKDTHEGKAHWKQELASNSEASVKADREELSSNARDTKTMQERTKDLPNQPASSHRT